MCGRYGIGAGAACSVSRGTRSGRTSRHAADRGFSAILTDKNMPVAGFYAIIPPRGHKSFLVEGLFISWSTAGSERADGEKIGSARADERV